jgi:hypothetical protein
MYVLMRRANNDASETEEAMTTTNETTPTQDANLETTRLPELQALYAEVLGEETRSPNKRFLVRRIQEARAAAAPAPDQEASLAAAEAPGVAASPAPEGTPAELPEPSQGPNVAPTPAPAEPAASPAEIKLTKLSVPELRAKYLEVVGRDTASQDRGYLIWKIRQAQKGKVMVGPVRQGRQAGDGAGGDGLKVLPLRMGADLVASLDEARVRLGLKSRMELFRRALKCYLEQAGESDVAGLFGR